MSLLIVSLMALALVAVLPWVRHRRRESRREQIRSGPFPEAWIQWLERDVRLYRMLPPPVRDELHRHILVFLDEKRFEGARGLNITDQMRVVVAAQACLLTLCRSPRHYPGLRSIIVYPEAFLVPTTMEVSSQVYVDDEEIRLGESWQSGAVVLAWDEVRFGARNPSDGFNVVLHEFAHQLDQQAGGGDGVPGLDPSMRPEDWSRILSDEYQQLQEDTARRRHTLIDAYGATNEAEFFAVATECFFEKPRQMKQKHPALYEQLQHYYRQDPAMYHEE